MKYSYIPQGTCSRQINIETDDTGLIKDISVVGGCNGNLQGVAALCRGRRPAEIAPLLRGIRCGNKTTSCPDQLSLALSQLVEKEG